MTDVHVAKQIQDQQKEKITSVTPWSFPATTNISATKQVSPPIDETIHATTTTLALVLVSNNDDFSIGFGIVDFHAIWVPSSNTSAVPIAVCQWIVYFHKAMGL
jgi:uncharacterized protein involved in cysteine biosynthesis